MPPAQTAHSPVASALCRTTQADRNSHSGRGGNRIQVPLLPSAKCKKYEKYASANCRHRSYTKAEQPPSASTAMPPHRAPGAPTGTSTQLPAPLHPHTELLRHQQRQAPSFQHCYPPTPSSSGHWQGPAPSFQHCYPPTSSSLGTSTQLPALLSPHTELLGALTGTSTQLPHPRQTRVQSFRPAKAGDQHSSRELRFLFF